MNAPASTKPASPAADFDIGPLLGTQPLASPMRQCIVLASACALLLCAWLIFNGFNDTARLLLALLPLIPAIFIARRFWLRFDVHADFGLHGIHLRRGSKALCTIPYTDISDFKYHTRDLMFDSTTPPGIRLQIITKDRFRFSIFSARIRPTFRATLPPLAHLDYAREIIAGVMSNSLHAKYTTTRKVEWTADLRFENADLVHKPLFGKERRIPMTSATVLLYEDRNAAVVNPSYPERSPFCTISRKHPRLWSGMALLTRLQHELAQPTKQPETQSTPTEP
jgi:hypothetical protein